MPYTIVKYQDTPNPNALKCVLDGAPSPAPRSYFNAGEAAGDPLGRAIFAVPGITNVLIHDGWISVCKTPDAAWRTIKPALERVLREAD